jgi:hypothetical protein
MHANIGQIMLRHPNFRNEVLTGHYDLLGPHGIITPDDWRATIKPGWAIAMKIRRTADATTIRPVEKMEHLRKIASKTEPGEKRQTTSSEHQIAAPRTKNARAIDKGKSVIIQDPKTKEHISARDLDIQDVPQARFVNVFEFLDEAERQQESVDRVLSGTRSGNSSLNVFDFLVEDDQEKDTQRNRIGPANYTGALSPNQLQRPGGPSRQTSFSQSSPAPLTYSRQGSRAQDPLGPSLTISRFPLISRIMKGQSRHRPPEQIDLASRKTSEIVTTTSSTMAENGSVSDTTSGTASENAAPANGSQQYSRHLQESSSLRINAEGRKSEVPPIFAWQVATNRFNDQRSSVPRSQSESVKRGIRHPRRDEDFPQTSPAIESDTLREILNEADDRIDYLLKKHPEMYYYFKRVTPRTRIDIEATMTKTDTRMIPLSNNIAFTKLDCAWEKKKEVVGQALKLLDSFVPPNQQSTLVDAFCGAMVEILEEDVSNQIPLRL